MPTKYPSGRVFIWYPDGGNVGHASLYIGNYEVGKKFELSLDRMNTEHYKANTLVELSHGRDFGNVHYNDNYVSWWPEGNAGPFDRAMLADPNVGLYKDTEAEETPPHVVYELYGLDVQRMRTCWHSVRDKPDAHYQLMRKNCADIVMRVLIAGGVKNRLGAIKAAWLTNNAFTTPKHIARICNELRDSGWAIKTKAGNCPRKTGMGEIWVMAGMR